MILRQSNLYFRQNKILKGNQQSFIQVHKSIHAQTEFFQSRLCLATNSLHYNLIWSCIIYTHVIYSDVSFKYEKFGEKKCVWGAPAYLCAWRALVHLHTPTDMSRNVLPSRFFLFSILLAVSTN